MTILSMILMASTMISALSTGETLPPLRGEFLTGRVAQLPDAASGRVALEFEVTGKANGAEQMNSR